jgi:hypothetical protein
MIERGEAESRRFHAAVTEANARGFRSSNNYRLRILFFCRKLDVMPA